MRESKGNARGTQGERSNPDNSAEHRLLLKLFINEAFKASKEDWYKIQLTSGTKFSWEFSFADRQFFVFCENQVLQLRKTGHSCWILIFAIFRKLRFIELQHFRLFPELHAIDKLKQYQCQSLTIVID